MKLETAKRSVANPRCTLNACASLGVVLVLAALVFLADPFVARAYEEPNDLGGSGGCSFCHPHPIYPDMDCDSCHGDDDDAALPGYVQGSFGGPHGGYTTGTSKCDNCHMVHNGPADGILLLPEATIVDTCFSCHDGTGGNGVYGVIEARTGVAPAGGHSYNQDTIIPGGDASDGGDAERVFKGPGGTLICTDCHSAHGSNVVDAFLGDRRRVRTAHPAIRSSRLLRQQPTGAATATAEYGSDWCLGCHAGRSSGEAVMNHPVDSEAKYSEETTRPYVYDNTAILDSDDPTTQTVVGPMGGIPGAVGFAHDWPAAPDAAGNRGYLMPYPRTEEQEGRAPICQQCHEDSRSVGELTGDGSVADAETAAVVAADGVKWVGTGWVDSWSTDNPAFQNFPHETMNANMLVEEYDDLCTNCHPAVALP